MVWLWLWFCLLVKVYGFGLRVVGFCVRVGVRVLCIREKYMQKSFQRFPKTPSQHLRNIEGEAWVPNESFSPGK